jgi:hypothetical protein
MNKQIIDVICVCVKCETPIRTLVLSTRLNDVALLCYDCQLTKLVNKRKVGI